MRRAEAEMGKPKKSTRRDDDDDDEEGGRKSKKKKPAKSNTLLFGLIGGGVAVLLLGCILAGVLGYVFWPKKDGGGNVAGANKGGGDKGGSDKGASADFTLTADALAKEFAANKNAVEAKYKGKTLELTGEFGGVALGYLIFKTVYKDQADVKGARVACSMLPEFLDKTGRMSKGQKVKVVGRFKEADFRVELSGCSLTELEPSKLTVTPADTLANEFEKNAAGASAKYKNQDVILSGAISDKGKTRDGVKCVRLGGGKLRCCIEIMPPDWDALKVGDQVELRGTFPQFVALEGNDIPIRSGMVLRPK
jgi:putative nucleic acid binding protein